MKRGRSVLVPVTVAVGLVGIALAVALFFAACSRHVSCPESVQWSAERCRDMNTGRFIDDGCCPAFVEDEE